MLNAEQNIIKSSTIEISSNWIKDKSKVFTLELTIKNSSNTDVLFYLDEMRCSKGASEGVLKHTFFNTGERTIDFRKGQTKRFRMNCRLNAPTDGDWTVIVSKVYENTGGDGKTRGKELEKDVKWTYHLTK